MFKVKAEKRPRVEALTAHGLPATSETFRKLIPTPICSGGPGRASCKPLSSAVKHSGTDVSMPALIKKHEHRSILVHGRWRMRHSHPHSHKPNLPRERERRNLNQLCDFFIYLFLHSQLSVRAQGSIWVWGGAHISPEEPVISVSFSLRQEIAAGTPDFSPVFFYFSQHQLCHSLWLI